MNKQAQAALLKELLEIAAQATNEPLALGQRGMSWWRGDDALSLPEPVIYAFLGLVGKLARKRPWSERVSEDYVQERLVSVLRSAREKGTEAAGGLFDEVVAEVEAYSVERTAYVPVTGLSLSVAALEVGGVLLTTVDDLVVDAVGHLLAPIPADADHDSRHGESVAGSQREFAEKLQGQVCAVFRTLAEPTRAKERAQEEARRALELVTYANAALHPFDRQADAVASLDAEQLPPVGPWIAVASSEGLHRFVSRAPTSWPITLTPAVLERYDEGGFWALSDLLARPAQELTDLDQALLRAVHWFAASQAQTELENRLLNLITCLEALVGPKNRAPISSSVAEGVALIVARGYHNRLGVKKFIGELYGARSGISHGGDKAVAESDVLELRWIVSTLIATLIRWKDGLRTRDRLLDWLERARLAGEPTEPPTLSKAKTLRELREERGWSQEELAGRVGRVSVDAEAVDRWERWSPPPPAIELCLFADALGVRPEEIALPPRERWLNVRGHLFHLTAHRQEPGVWIARISAYDHTDAVKWPVRPVDPEYPDVDSPFIMAEWRSTGFTADKALAALADRNVAAMERALSMERLPDDPPDWQPPEMPEHWRRHLAARNKRG